MCVDTQDVTVEVIEPDPPFPCPNKRVVYECTVEGYIAIRWILPPDDMTVLAFAGFEDLGSNESNGTFTAFLNMSDRMGDTFSITSTLLIQCLDNLNASSLTCGGVPSSGDTVDRMIPIIVSGEYIVSNIIHTPFNDAVTTDSVSGLTLTVYTYVNCKRIHRHT